MSTRIFFITNGLLFRVIPHPYSDTIDIRVNFPKGIETYPIYCSQEDIDIQYLSKEKYHDKMGFRVGNFHLKSRKKISYEPFWDDFSAKDMSHKIVFKFLDNYG